MKTNWYKYLYDQIHDPQYEGKRVRRLSGRVFDLGTVTGRWSYAGEIIKYLDALASEEREYIVKEVAVLTGINIDEVLYTAECRNQFGTENVNVIDKQDVGGDVVRCKECCKWHTVACPMVGNVESLIVVSTMFNDDKVLDYALNRYCSEAEREVRHG